MRSIFLFFLIIHVLCLSSMAQRVALQIDADHIVNYIVTDPQGRRCGVDPRGAKTIDEWKWYREIPHANYSFQSVGNLDPNGPVDVAMEFVYHFNSPEGDGLYTIKVMGNKLGKFDLYVSASAKPPLQESDFEATHVPIDKDSVITYEYTYHGPAGSIVRFVKIVSARSLLQDIAAMRKLNWIKDQPTADKYADLMSNYGRHVHQKDFGNARTTLKSVLQTIPADSLTGLTTDACKLLRDDTQQLLNELPPAISSLSPMFTIAAGDGFNLTVKGLPFISGCSVTWNGSSRTTTFISMNDLRGSILTSDVATAGTSDVAVKTPDGKTSNSLSFYVISAVNWVDTLISYKHKAVDLGWLKNKQDDDCDDDEKPDDGVVRNLDNRFDKVKKELLRKDSSKARSELDKFVKKLNRMRKRSEEAEKRSRPNQVVLTVEGYNLLKTNTEYLIDRLPDRKPKRSSKDKD